MHISPQLRSLERSASRYIHATSGQRNEVGQLWRALLTPFEAVFRPLQGQRSKTYRSGDAYVNEVFPHWGRRQRYPIEWTCPAKNGLTVVSEICFVVVQGCFLIIRCILHIIVDSFRSILTSVQSQFRERIARILTIRCIMNHILLAQVYCIHLESA